MKREKQYPFELHPDNSQKDFAPGLIAISLLVICFVGFMLMVTKSDEIQLEAKCLIVLLIIGTAFYLVNMVRDWMKGRRR